MLGRLRAATSTSDRCRVDGGIKMEFQPTTVCKHLFIPCGTGNHVSYDSQAKKTHTEGWLWLGDSYTVGFCFVCVDVWSDVPLEIWRPQTLDLAQSPPGLINCSRASGRILAVWSIGLMLPINPGIYTMQIRVLASKDIDANVNLEKAFDLVLFVVF